MRAIGRRTDLTSVEISSYQRPDSSPRTRKAAAPANVRPITVIHRDDRALSVLNNVILKRRACPRPRGALE